MTRLAGRKAIVTGAAGGIGGAIARTFAREGADLVLVDLKSTAEVAAAVREAGREAVEAQADVSDRAQVVRLVERAREAFGRIDVLVNCAGTASFGSAETLAESEWDRMLAVNLKSAFLCAQAVIPTMRAQGYGRIVSIGSVVAKNGGNARSWIDRGDLAGAANVAYGVAKAGVHAMTLFLAKELAADGITVNAVAPGPIDVRRRSEGVPRPGGLTAQIPVGRIGQPEEVAEAVTFLASERAGFVTAEILDVNGGLWGD